MTDDWVVNAHLSIMTLQSNCISSALCMTGRVSSEDERRIVRPSRIAAHIQIFCKATADKAVSTTHPRSAVSYPLFYLSASPLCHPQPLVDRVERISIQQSVAVQSVRVCGHSVVFSHRGTEDKYTCNIASSFRPLSTNFIASSLSTATPRYSRNASRVLRLAYSLKL